MSTIFRDRDGKTIDAGSLHDEDAECQVCARTKADAVWHCPGGNNIAVCYWCAVRTLPALIADAMGARPDRKDILGRTHERMEAAFWRAAAGALARDPEPLDSSDSHDRQMRQPIGSARSAGQNGTVP
jgi:hypothetical protein